MFVICEINVIEYAVFVLEYLAKAILFVLSSKENSLI